MSSFLFSLLLIFIFTSQLTTADVDQGKNFQYFCDQNNDGGIYTTNSTYHTNLNTLLSILTSNKEINYGFYNSSYGINSDKVNAIGLCRGDLKPNDCRNCLQNSTVFLTQRCQNRKQAIGWYDDDRCMLRYSSRSIFGLYDTRPYYESWSLKTAINEDEFDKVRKNLLDNLRNRAASGDSDLKYAVGSDEVGPNNNQTIYGLAQCTPDLFKTFCDDCLVQSINEIAICCNNRMSARVVRPSCYLRYETDSLFYQPTQDSPSPSSLSPSPTSVPSLAAPPPFANNTTSYPGKSNNYGSTIGIAIGVPIALVAMVFIFICIYLKVRKPKKRFEEVQEEEDDDKIEITEGLQFHFNTIRIATNDFSDSDKLGQGGFGVVYKVK